MYCTLLELNRRYPSKIIPSQDEFCRAMQIPIEAVCNCEDAAHLAGELLIQHRLLASHINAVS
jgi:hypothetical protein